MFAARRGISRAEYEEMLLDQNFRCAICKKKGQVIRGSRYRLHLDHCHKTNTNRQLLCFTCNVGLGMFKDNPKIMKEALLYLIRHRHAHND